MWEKQTAKKKGKSHALGHSLGLEDLEKVLEETKSKMRHREYNRQFDSGKPPEKDNKRLKITNRPKKTSSSQIPIP